jgi:hypothetical protein
LLSSRKLVRERISEPGESFGRRLIAREGRQSTGFAQVAVQVSLRSCPVMGVPQ